MPKERIMELYPKEDRALTLLTLSKLTEKQDMEAEGVSDIEIIEDLVFLHIAGRIIS